MASDEAALTTSRSSVAIDTHQDLLHRRRREPRRNGAWYRIVLHHPSRLPWRCFAGSALMASCIRVPRGANPPEYLSPICPSRSPGHLATLRVSARARGASGPDPVQPIMSSSVTKDDALPMRFPRPRRRAQDAGSRWPKQAFRSATECACGCCTNERLKDRQSRLIRRA